MPRTIRIDNDVYRWLQSQATPFEDSPNSVLRRLAGPSLVLGKTSDPVAEPDAEHILPTPRISEQERIIRQVFFQRLIDELRKNYKLMKAKKGTDQPWQPLGSDRSVFIYYIAFVGTELRIWIHIYTRDAERNKAIFDWFFARKEEIEREMQESLVWERLDYTRSSRICAVLPNTPLADAMAREDELRRWSIDHFQKLKEVFGPKLSSALGANPSAEPA
jgi:hypothetical protein